MVTVGASTVGANESRPVTEGLARSEADATRWGQVSASPAAPSGPRAPRRTETVDVPGYPGFTVTLWTNFPQRLATQLNAPMPEDPAEREAHQGKLSEVLSQIVQGHNGWCDYDGNPYPTEIGPAFWDAIPTELAVVVIRLINVAMLRLPNSISAQRGR